MTLKLILISIVFLAIALAGIGIKILIQKNGQFKKSCSSADPSGRRIGCSCGGDGDDSSCENYQVHHGSSN
jgi:hypothetical protein